jgi:hypothetical protein
MVLESQELQSDIFQYEKGIQTRNESAHCLKLLGYKTHLKYQHIVQALHDCTQL